MMNHLLFWGYIIAGTLGVSVIIISAFLSVKYDIRPLFRYSVFLGLLGLLFFTEILELYSAIAKIPFYTSNSQINIISYITLIFVISVYFPFFITRFRADASPKKEIILIIFPALLFAAVLVLYFSGVALFVLADIADILFFVIICSWVIYFLKNMYYLPGPGHKVKFRTLLLIILFFVPFSVLNIFFPSADATGKPDFVSIPFLIFYFGWNLLNLIYALKIFFQPGEKNPLKEKITSFAAAYRLSRREKEIVSLIVSGESNKSIGFALNISERTVKNHIYNIYKKAEVQSRTELFVKLYKQVSS